MLDLLVTNAALPDGRTGMSVAVQGGRIVEVTPGLVAPAAQTVDAGGQLLTSPFCDPHFHMDATLSYGLPRVNESGTLLEGIAVWGELKPMLQADDLIARALTYCDWAVARGLLAIRSHVDTSDPSLLPVEALLEVKKRVAPYIDLQLVAFPQDGVLRIPGGIESLKRALDLGVDVVGGIPHFERTMSEGAASVKLLCEIAAERGKLVDMHCDETDDPMSRHMESLAAERVRLGLMGGVAGSHLTSLHAL
jgi:cytosine deaminase